MHEPYTFLNGLTVTDMDDLLEDIKVQCVCVCVLLCVLLSCVGNFYHWW